MERNFKESNVNKRTNPSISWLVLKSEATTLEEKQIARKKFINQTSDYSCDIPGSGIVIGPDNPWFMDFENDEDGIAD